MTGHSSCARVLLACACVLAVAAPSFGGNHPASAATPTIQILTPNAGQTWPVETQQLITWTTANLSASAVVTLWFWDGSAWTRIADAGPGQTSYTWTVPRTSVPQGWIYIWSRVGAVTEAEAWSEAFTIVAGPSIRILTPNAGQTWLVGTERLITWTSSKLSRSAVVTVWFWNGGTWTRIVECPPSQTSYAWTVPRQASATQAWIYIWSQVEGVTEAQAWSEPFPVTDASLSTRELSHGSTETQGLAAQAGPVADTDSYHVAQGARSSYEVVVDAVSGDVQPLGVERLAADTTTVLTSSVVVGTGPSRSLRWQNPLSASVADEPIRVRSGSCTTACGSDDVYRIRMYETTYTIARFNNAGTQVSVLFLQNPASYAIAGTVYFWSGTGALLHAQPFSLAPKAAYVLSASSIPALRGTSGTVTVANDGRYGDLVGKAVALESTTGFSFDSPMIPRLTR